MRARVTGCANVNAKITKKNVDTLTKTKKQGSSAWLNGYQ
jgi:hypothetical protein